MALMTIYLGLFYISLLGGNVGKPASYPESRQKLNQYGVKLPHICPKNIYKIEEEYCK